MNGRPKPRGRGSRQAEPTAGVPRQAGSTFQCDLQAGGRGSAGIPAGGEPRGKREKRETQRRRCERRRQQTRLAGTGRQVPIPRVSGR